MHFYKSTILILESLFDSLVSSSCNAFLSNANCKIKQGKTKGGKLFCHVRDSVNKGFRESCVNFQFNDRCVVTRLPRSLSRELLRFLRTWFQSHDSCMQ